MALKIGNNAVANAFVGASQVRRAYKGGTLVYQGFSPASEQEFIEQTAAGGPAQLLKVYGKTIVNNQIVEGGAGSHSIAAAAFSFSDFAFTLTSGHKVFIAFNGQNVMGRRFNCQNGSGSIVAISSFAPSSDGQFAQIFPTIASGRVYLMAIDSAVSTSIVSDFISVDLTLRFGAGNEPTSVDEALRLLGGDAFDPTYDPGSLQSNKTAELRAYDGGNLRGSLALNLSTLTGKLNGEGQSVVVYPDGLRGVGTDRDEAYGSTGVVRLGKRAYQTGDESDTSVLTDGTNTIYPLATPQTYTLDTPLPTDLSCVQGDILQRVSDNNCPFVGEMKFGL